MAKSSANAFAIVNRYEKIDEVINIMFHPFSVIIVVKVGHVDDDRMISMMG